jgi:hypothetical protein
MRAVAVAQPTIVAVLVCLVLVVLAVAVLLVQQQILPQ